MKKIIVENLASLPTLSLQDLREKYEANGLKEKKNRDIGSLKHSILKHGFKVPIIIWKEGKYITDGTGRLQALEMLDYEGYEIPAIPYFPISAKDRKEAKELSLAISSRFGEITEESLKEFIAEMPDIDLGLYELGLDLEKIEIDPKPEKEKKKSTTIFKHKCPHCNKEF